MSGLILVNSGLLIALDWLREKFAGNLLIGLFQNDLVPNQGTTVGAIDECTFSGYGGRVLLSSWSDPLLNGNNAQIQANEVVWTHDGGTLSNWVFGYFVVNLSGTLVWVERQPGAARPMIFSGTEYRVSPRFSLKSRYP